jgi:hypothetical protein
VHTNPLSPNPHHWQFKFFLKWPTLQPPIYSFHHTSILPPALQATSLQPLQSFVMGDFTLVPFQSSVYWDSTQTPFPRVTADCYPHLTPGSFSTRQPTNSLWNLPCPPMPLPLYCNPLCFFLLLLERAKCRSNRTPPLLQTNGMSFPLHKNLLPM